MSKKFDKLLEAATDSTLIEPNWDAIIACFDSVRAGEVPGKAAMTALRKRIQHDNPHVVMHALLVLDACVKNCGKRIHEEVATREFMEEFKNLGIENSYDEVKNKVLEMLQCWAMAFANKPEYKIVVDTHNLMKLAGFDFPSIKEAEAMFMAQVAPEWHDGNECYRCRAEFGLLTRKHHCRACGQIFCDRCSSHEMALPQFGIEKEVRVCDSCFESARPPTDRLLTSKAENLPQKTVSSEVSQEEKDKLLKEKEEEDLALALAISKSEAEAKEQDRQKNMFSMYNGNSESNNLPSEAASLSSYIPSESGYKGVASSGSVRGSAESSGGEPAVDDPLARYLNRDYWQARKNNSGAAASLNKVDEWAGASGVASAPLPSESSLPSGAATLVDEPLSLMTLDGVNDSVIPVNDTHTQQVTEATVKWCKEVSEQVGVMESRVRSNTARGRSVVNDSAIQGLFLRLTELHSQVLDRMGKLDEERGYFEGLQDHIAHIMDARSAVNTLREESERKRQERVAEEQRMRQTQMKQTLDMMRIKKHTMLMEQRDMALQRFQQQEQEMQARRMQQPYYPASSGYAPSHIPSMQYSQAGMYQPPPQQQQHPGYYQPAPPQSQYSQAPPPHQQQSYSMPSGYPQQQQAAGGYTPSHPSMPPPVSQSAAPPPTHIQNQQYAPHQTPQQQHNYYEQQQQYQHYAQPAHSTPAPIPQQYSVPAPPAPAAQPEASNQQPAVPNVSEAALISFD